MHAVGNLLYIHSILSWSIISKVLKNYLLNVWMITYMVMRQLGLRKFVFFLFLLKEKNAISANITPVDKVAMLFLNDIFCFLHLN